MRVLALDYGSARCGAAVSDPTGSIATPLEPVLRPGTRKGMGKVVHLVAEVEAEVVLVGLPLSLTGRDSGQTRETREWAERLQRLIGKVPVELRDERFTTKIANQRGGSASEDSMAAAVLLEDYLAMDGPGSG